MIVCFGLFVFGWFFVVVVFCFLGCFFFLWGLYGYFFFGGVIVCSCCFLFLFFILVFYLILFIIRWGCFCWFC